MFPLSLLRVQHLVDREVGVVVAVTCTVGTLGMEVFRLALHCKIVAAERSRRHGDRKQQ